MYENMFVYGPILTSFLIVIPIDWIYKTNRRNQRYEKFVT